MKNDEKFTKRGFVRAYVVPAFLLFAIPLGGWTFARYATRSWDQRFYEDIAKSLAADREVTGERREEVLAFYRAQPASSLCAEGRGALPRHFAEGRCKDFAQLRSIGQASLASLGLGLSSLLIMLACAALSFASRPLQYLSFVAGWNFLRVASALQVLAQGFVAVMLSFWVTAFFIERYFVKLILLVGLMALAAAAAVIASIFKQPDDRLNVEGELLTRERSPTLWARIEALCARLGTAPPAHIVGGIDDNFFVTEHPLHLGQNVLTGRSLFVSLSLLKRLEKNEADAVLTHEMAHFSGGDTLYSKQLSPLLSRYRAYLLALYAGGLSRPIFYFMLLNFSLFQLALGRSSRQRELRADKIAAETTSPTSMLYALYKIAAYSAYRARVEAGLLERDRRHSQLDIAFSVAAGFSDYACGPHLAADLTADAFPHPFDSHPSLEVRLANIGVQPGSIQVADTVTTLADETWFDDIGDAERIEAGLWKVYEERFLAVHELTLAYRYLPSTPDERAHVERFFPKLELAGPAATATLALDCEALHYGEWAEALPWSSITEIKAEDTTLRGKIMTVKLHAAEGHIETRKLALRKLCSNEDEVTDAISRYYGRYLSAKSQ